jgi:replicative DNA helicase
MKIEKINNNQEKNIITGLITSDKFCKEIIPIIEINLFRVSYIKIICKWCINYFEKYNQAPKNYIQKIYKNNEEKEDPDLIELIYDFLSNLSDEYKREEGFNEDYAIDQSLEYLRTQKLKNLKKDIDEALQIKESEKAEELVEKYNRVQKQEFEVIDLFEDKEKIKEALNYEEEELFSLPGAYGGLFHSFNRGDLIAFAAPAKRGKTWFLIDIAVKAFLYGCKVIFFSFEMTKPQIMRRIYQNILAELKKKGNEIIKLPVFRYDEKKDNYYIDYDNVNKKGLIIKNVFSKLKKLKRNSKKGKLKLVCSPPNAITINNMKKRHDDLYKKTGFNPDIWVVDYADIIKAENKAEHRHTIDQKWLGLKNSALEKHIAIVTASHSNKSTFKKNVEQSDMSEDTRKMNHVSVMIGLNQNKDEKKAGLMRLQTLAHRHEQFVLDEVLVTQNLNIGKPVLDSKFAKQVDENSLKKTLEEVDDKW